MIRTIRVLAVAGGMIAVALSAWMFHAYLVDLSVRASRAGIGVGTNTMP